ncbi:MAG: uroporphyrinogen decarboxylase family protein, partial [Candidatus Oleimicrobiaceae bacterium]
MKIWEPFQMLGAVEDDLLEAMGVDTIGVVGPTTMFGFRNEEWREARMPWGQVVLVSKHFQTSPAPGGGLYLYPQGDRTAPPSGHMPAGGFFFDTIVRQPPLDEANLNPADNTEEFTPISSEDLQYFQREAAKAAASGRSPVATFGGTAFGDIALVPAPFLKYPKGIRDVAEWYMATVTHRDYIHAVFARQCEIALSNLEKLHAVVGAAIDVVFVCGTDFGTQLGQFCSVETFNELYAPYYQRVNDWVHQHTKWRTFKHSC